MKHIAIVGAGVAGAGVAYALGQSDTDCSVFERASDIGGRTATRRTHGCLCDTGANYAKSDERTVDELITETLSTDGLTDIDAPVWTFTADGTISEGDDTDEHKWTYEDGIAQLPARLFDRADTNVVRNTRVQTIVREDGCWSLASESGDDLGVFDALVLTPPAPQSAALIEGMHWEHDLREELLAAVEGVEYRSIYTVLLHYPFELEVPYYALVNTDREHEIGWVSREECKPNHADGESLLVVQMAPDWSARRIDATIDPAENASDAAELTADLFDDDRLASPDWTDTKKWHHALPNSEPDFGDENDARQRAEQHGLYLAGDWLAGEGRIHLALKHGLAVGERIDEQTTQC